MQLIKLRKSTMMREKIMTKKYRIGKISNTHGLKGEVKVYSYADYVERFEEVEYVYISEEKYYIEKVRYHKNMPIIKFKGMDNINQIEHLKGMELFIDENNLRELEDDEYMVSDLVNCKVYIDNGTFIGTVTDVLLYAANDVYVVKNEEREFLIPVIKDVVTDIDISNKKIIIKNMEGLLD